MLWDEEPEDDEDWIIVQNCYAGEYGGDNVCIYCGQDPCVCKEI